jgi:HPt (histidine-containing phosphotransfer) domain-containing protein
LSVSEAIAHGSAASSAAGRLKPKAPSAKLVNQFVAGLAQRMAAMHAALETSDIVKLKSLAHQLRGAAGGYGFPAIGQAAHNLETGCAAGAPKPEEAGQLRHLVESLANLCSQTRAEAA